MSDTVSELEATTLAWLQINCDPSSPLKQKIDALYAQQSKKGQPVTANKSELLLLADRINRSGFACPPNQRERALIIAALIKWATQEMPHEARQK